MQLLLTHHARERVKLRGINYRWIQECLIHSKFIKDHPRDPSLKIVHYWIQSKRKWLKVIVRFSEESSLIITAHFDRNFKGILP